MSGADWVDPYLRRIGHDHRPSADLAGLSALMLAHLTTVPFENLDVFHQRGVTLDRERNVSKIVDGQRGGWCFELNGAFGSLLTELGFEVRHLGAAVLLSGPTTVIDHLCLEVRLDQPYLVDVGFGDTFVSPLRLNDSSPQPGGNGTYQLMASPIGTTLAREVDGVPAAQYRFKRVSHDMADFESAQAMLYDDPDSHFRRGPVVTRLLDPLRRVTLSTDRLTVRHSPDADTPLFDTAQSDTEQSGLVGDAWWAAATEWFGPAYAEATVLSGEVGQRDQDG